MRESRTYGSVRGGAKTHVPTATKAEVYHAARRRCSGVAARSDGRADGEGPVRAFDSSSLSAGF